MVLYVASIVQAKSRPLDGVVLAQGATLPSPRFVSCGAKPFAVIVDAEGTVLPGLDAAPGATVRTEEAQKAFDDLRFGHVTVIYTSDRPLADVDTTEAALEHAHLGPAMQDHELVMSRGGPKDALRAEIAQHYCVLALVGDAPADFADALANSTAPAALPWGTGWFRIPAQVGPTP